MKPYLIERVWSYSGTLRYHKLGFIRAKSIEEATCKASRILKNAAIRITQV